MLLIILAAWFCTTTWVITPHEEFARDVRRSAYCYVIYPDKNLPVLTKAPEGYEPFYTWKSLAHQCKSLFYSN